MDKVKMSLKKIPKLLLLLCLSIFLTSNNSTAMEMAAGHDMFSHHQHIMLNHALGMALEGYNLVMLGDMGMAEGVDEESVKHGNMMVKNGKALWTEIMSGKAMMGMHHKGIDPMKDPVMSYTHKLAEKQLKVMDLLGKMPKMGSGHEGGHNMAIHHQHIMLNHALKMALEGSNLVMLGQMGMAEGVDSISVKHGEMMIKNAKTLFNEVFSGKHMMDMHKAGTSPEKNELMMYTHKLAEAQMQVMALLDEMPSVK